jgi:peptide/nickel transport system substrate-binding protein
MWSDGTPLTSADFAFTYEYCTHPEGGCAQASFFDGVASVETPDERTVVVNFEGPTPFPYTAFVGSESPVIQAAQFADCLGARAPECTEANFGPIGTGPFVVDEFRPNDVIEFSANPNFRNPDQPGFATVTFRGGGDAVSAARSVCQTGEFDYAWNLQIDPQILRHGSRRALQVVVAFGTSVERLHLNQTNPDPALGDVRSTAQAGPHPFLTNPVIGQAMSMAIDRALLVEVGYGAGGQPTCNVLPAPELYASTANDACLTQDIPGAIALLDEAGIVDTDGDGIREYEGTPLSVVYQTSTNAVRQDTQALVQAWWAELGIDTELRNIDASVFFGGDPASPDTFQKFYADIEMYTNNFAGVDPQAYMASWLCDDWPRPEHPVAGLQHPALLHAGIRRARRRDGRHRRPRGTWPPCTRDERHDRSGLLDHPADPPWRRLGPCREPRGVKMSDWDSELWNIAEWTRTPGMERE